jgi:exonuclease SbcC
MRLHELSITAFGPFVETVHVDFDELAAGGVFLLTGDTGAGKTSVLDAVCFALYGEVPGDRHSARHLRSDHADAVTHPRVVLRLTIGERSFRFTRSPAWDRAKRRGTGTTRVQAHVVVEEQRSGERGEWIALTNRLDEAGQLVAALLGMTCTQFTQVAMLPQGRFQAFLRATSAERHAVLQRLFRTSRFEEVERWLVERRVTLRRNSQACHDHAAGVVNRLQEAAGVGVPDSWDLHELDPLLDDGSLFRWAEELVDRSTDVAADLEASLAAATQQLDLDRAACERGRQLAEARSRGERATATLAELERTEDVEKALDAAVDAHRRAAPVLPTIRRAEAAAQAAADSETAGERQLAAAARVLGHPPEQLRPEQWAEAATRATEARAVAESWLPRERQLHDERARVARLATELVMTEREISAGVDERSRLAAERHRVLPVLAETRTTAARCDARRLAVQTAEAGLAAAQQAASLVAQLDDARALLAETRQQAQDLREHYQDLREQRISGMAAELALGLAAGGSCPVCGSAEHPFPAVSSRRVSRADEEAARQQHETADFSRQAVQESVTALQSQLHGALSRSQELDVAHWQDAFGQACAALEESLEAVRRTQTLEDELAAVESRDRELAAALASARATRAAQSEQLAESERRCAGLTAELVELLTAHPDAQSVAALVELHAHSARVFTAAHDAVSRHQRAVHELAQSTAAAQQATASAGFATVDEARAAMLSDAEAAARTSSLDTRRAARRAASDVLAEPTVAAAMLEPAPDLTGLTDAARESEAARDRLHAAHQHAAGRVHRLRALRRTLLAALATWKPVRHQHLLAAGLASLVEGRSADNQLKMRLSAYVLSERLRQVVAAANERLCDMTDRRYALEQADEKGAGEQRGGLSLRVRDEWSGKQRDPATLSGGETFLVSLALALGLADTVTHEAGGTQLDTLFIDEGFGALDATTLDGVMDTLDSLRDGGRVVGLVSHVAELRNRVPCQLEVRKARRGSTLFASVVGG